MKAFATEGSAAPIDSAMSRLIEPATRPFTIAIQLASDKDTFRVRLLSMPQAKQAPRIASDGQSASNRASPGQDKITAPATIASIPKAICRSKFSLNANQASKAVNTPSMLSSNAVADAVLPFSPIINSTGPTTPPDAIAPANQIRSDAARVTGAALMACRYKLSPIPEPRYGRLASIHGLIVSSSAFANGVAAPNKTADPSAARIPGCFSTASCIGLDVPKEKSVGAHRHTPTCRAYYADYLPVKLLAM